ncbi:MAG TPA: biopolymer transporter ExbD [Phycisphaerales bacterium]|nr:biopolymer transporter ExbD [Phycisphaerales bacterium]
MSTAHTRRRSKALARRDALHNYSLHFGPNMTPMVDVVMVILIFFMASAAFMGDEWFLRTAIPFEAGRGTATNKPNDPLALPPTRLDVQLDVDRNGQTIVTVLDLKEAPLQAFLDRVATFPQSKETSEMEVVIRAAGAVPYRDVVRAHSACDAAGIVKVGISVKRAPASAPAGAGGGAGVTPPGGAR